MRQCRQRSRPTGRACTPGLQAWLHRLLQKDPHARFRCAADAAWALRQLEPERPIPAADRLPTGLSPDDATEWAVRVAPADAATVRPPKGAEDRSMLPTLSPGAEVFASRGKPTDRPPMPPSWRGPPVAPLDGRLVGAGLGLYGLRTGPYVGREEQRDQLWSALAEVDAQGAHIVALRGPSGVARAAWPSG